MVSEAAHDPIVYMERKPLLTIAVPAYGYAEGVGRIFSRLWPLPQDCEVLVFDNSADDDDEVEETVAGWCAATSMQVTYQRNRPEFGAAGNWNALIDAAQGEFCWLLHHDEFPLSGQFLTKLTAVLRAEHDLDVLVLDCILVNPRTGQNRRHLPAWLRALVVKRFPGYLFRRNVIGPTAAVVARRSLYPRFDTKLRWLVDVDAYVRLLRVTKRVAMCPELQIGSLLGRGDSITARLAPSISQIENEERCYLKQREPAPGFWLGPGAQEPRFKLLVRAAESVGWKVMRVATRIGGGMRPGPLSRSWVREALRPEAATPPELTPTRSGG